MRGNSISEEFKNAFGKSNNSHIQLILINVIVFVMFGVLFVFSNWTSTLSPIYDFLYDQFSIPATSTEFITRPWTVITYMFMHGGLMHILFNMLWFYYFGRLIIEYLGSDKLISIYILGGLAGGALYLFMYNVIPFYQERSLGTEMVGASAAVDAIVVAAAVLLPNYAIHLLFFGPVKLKYIAIFSVGMSFLGMTGGNAGGNIAHLGGAAIGYFYIRQLNSGTDIGRWINVTLTFIKSFFVSQPKMKVHSNKRNTTKKTSSASKSSKATKSSLNVNQAEIDAILDKISQSGYESLSKEEKQKLFNASKK
ncbi:MAG: rhomboid family intramembrane serine protease [Cyclobacteriaceae bacterium]|nr:rhomboid family intramembrane serine protease [Cyclobacteriaceae bacterium]